MGASPLLGASFNLIVNPTDSLLLKMSELFDARSTPDNGDKAKGNDQNDRSKALSEQALHALSVEFSLSQQFHKAERSNPNALDLIGEAGYSALYQGAQSPITSLGQIGDNLLSKGNVKTNIADAVTLLSAPEHEEFGTARWHAQQIGGGIGMILPFMATKSALSKTGLSFAARTEASVYASSKLASTANAGLVADGALTGFAYDFFLRPVEQQDSNRFWVARGEHGLAGAATFGTLTAGSVGLRHMSRSLAASLVDAPKVARVAYDATMGALPGIPAGIVNADASARLSKGRWATTEERTQGAYTMVMAGGALSALHSIPGSEVPLGDIARAYETRKAATQNLESMLAERARSTEATAAYKSVTVPESAKLTGRGSTDHSSRAVSDGVLRPGRAMASSDVEKVAQPTDVQLVVPKEHVETLRTGVDLAFKASDVDCTPQQVLEFFNFARGQGAPIKQAMLDVAKQYAAEDPHMMTLIREAYMPPEGVENRVVEGDVKLKTSNATTDQYTRWGQFMQIVREMPQDTAGYIEFRHDVFRWLNENKDLHDWAKQYGEQNRYSKIAGPLDYYFGTANLDRFVAADAAAHPSPKPEPQANSAEAKPADKPVDLVVDPPASKTTSADLSLLNVDGLPLAAKLLVDKPTVADLEPAFQPAETRPRLEAPATESEPAFRDSRPQPPSVLNNEFNGLERGGPGMRRIVANTLAERIGSMTTDEFGRWLDYVYAKPAEGTTTGAMNLSQMFIKQKAALLNPDVVESYLRYKGAEVAPREGANEIPLEQVRRFLSTPPKAPQGAMPEWMEFYINARLAQARQSAGADATPAKVMSDALPRWFTERLKAEYVTPGRWAGNAPTYSSNMPKEIAQQFEAARRTEAPEPNRAPKKEFAPPINNFDLRLEALNKVAAVDDPVIRDRLMELGSKDHTLLKNIVQKLDPAKNAPEYRELLRIILPEAKNLNDVKLLLDTIFFGNKANRNDAGSEQTKANLQLAMALTEHIIPQSNENFGRVNQIVGDMITGKIRDPRPERPGGDGPGSDQGGRPGQQGKGDREERRGSSDDSPWGAAVKPFISPVISPAVSPIMGGRGSRGISRAVEEARARIGSETAAKQRSEADAALKAQQDAARQQLELAASLAIQHAIRVASQRQEELSRVRMEQDQVARPYHSPISRPYSSPVSRPSGPIGPRMGPRMF